MDVGYNQLNKEVRVRFAPSPTGNLHIGGLRTALYNYLFAARHNGKFILRVEDTDKVREVEGSMEKIIDALKWSGINYDEGPGSIAERDNSESGVVSEDGKPMKYLQGPYPPYTQSERIHIYKKFADTLVENGDAYHCFCTTERLK